MRRSHSKRPRWLILASMLVVLTCVAVFSEQVSEHYYNSPAKAAVPASSQPADTEAGEAGNLIHQDIVTTVFWAGEGSSEANGDITNTESAWVDDWLQEFGGEDTPTARNGYLPAAFIPKQNAFYAALPYNDYTGTDGRKSRAGRCLSVAHNSRSDYSWCKNIWLKISLSSRTVYAQWEDVGPFGEDDDVYVFDGARPANTTGEQAGLDISPASRDYLVPGNHDGADGTYRTSWQFVPASAVPDGPWKQTITTTTGRRSSY